MLKAVPIQRWQKIGEEERATAPIQCFGYAKGKIFVGCGKPDDCIFMFDINDKDWKDNKIKIEPSRASFVKHFNVSPDGCHLFIAEDDLEIIELKTMKRQIIDDTIEYPEIVGNNFFGGYESGCVEINNLAGYSLFQIYTDNSDTDVDGVHLVFATSSSSLYIFCVMNNSIFVYDTRDFARTRIVDLSCPPFEETSNHRRLMVLNHYFLVFYTEEVEGAFLKLFDKTGAFVTCVAPPRRRGGWGAIVDAHVAGRGCLVVRTSKFVELIRLRQPRAVCLLGGIRQRNSLLWKTAMRSKIFDPNALRASMQMAGVLLDLSVEE